MANKTNSAYAEYRAADLRGWHVHKQRQKYPEALKYLGWCTWGQYYKSIDEHILLSVFDGIESSGIPVRWLGQTLWPDHDMFHSSDKDVDSTMAVTKSMGGGPIYLPDAPAHFDKKIILPLCYRDGLLLRPLAPGVPVPDSIFGDALYDKNSAYKVIAPLNNRSCAIVVYNLNLNSKATVSGVIASDDYTYGSSMLQPYPGLWEVPAEGLVVYDWQERKCEKLGKDGRAFNARIRRTTQHHCAPIFLKGRRRPSRNW